MGEYTDLSRVSAPLPATHTPIGGEFFRNLFRDSVLTGAWQYRGYLLGRPDWKEEGSDAQELIQRIRGFVEKPEKTEVRAKTSSRRLPQEFANNQLLLRSDLHGREWYEIALGFPEMHEGNGGTRSRSLEVQPSKIRTTRRGGTGIDPYHVGLMMTQLKERMSMHGVRYIVLENVGQERQFVHLQPTVRRRDFSEMYGVVEETFHYLRHQPRRSSIHVS